MSDRLQQLGGRTTGGQKMLVVASGMRGVGATTIAAKLAAALANDAQRVVLIDADLRGGNLGPLCKLSSNVRIGDVLAGKKNIHEALQLGPAGIQVLAGFGSTSEAAVLDQRAIQRLLRQIASLAPHADWLIVDGGDQPSELALRLWSTAERVLLITAPQAAAIMETYILVKTLVSLGLVIPGGSLAVAVNQASDEQAAADVHRRIDQSCRRFLGVSIGNAGYLTSDPEWASAIQEPAGSLLAEAFRQFAERVIREWQQTIPQRSAA